MKIFEVTSYEGVSELKKRIETILSKLKFDIEFGHHFVNDRLLNRESGIRSDEIRNTIQKFRNKYRYDLVKLKKSSLENREIFAGIIKDYDQDINIVFSIYGNKLKLMTIMRHDPKTFGTYQRGEVDFPV